MLNSDFFPILIIVMMKRDIFTNSGENKDTFIKDLLFCPENALFMHKKRCFVGSA